MAGWLEIGNRNSFEFHFGGLILCFRGHSRIIVWCRGPSLCVSKWALQDTTDIFPVKFTEDIFVCELKDLVHAELPVVLAHAAAVRLKVTMVCSYFFCWFIDRIFVYCRSISEGFKILALQTQAFPWCQISWDQLSSCRRWSTTMPEHLASLLKPLLQVGILLFSFVTP